MTPWEVLNSIVPRNYGFEQACSSAFRLHAFDFLQTVASGCRRHNIGLKCDSAVRSNHPGSCQNGSQFAAIFVVHFEINLHLIEDFARAIPQFATDATAGCITAASRDSQFPSPDSVAPSQSPRIVADIGNRHNHQNTNGYNDPAHDGNGRIFTLFPPPATDTGGWQR